jgi:Lon protease-like protein
MRVSMPELYRAGPAGREAHDHGSAAGRVIPWLSMELPLFPLHVVLFPGRPLPLHLFEPRYRQMLQDCLDADRRFGVIAIRSGREVADDPEVFEVGTVAHVEDVKELPDGRYDITIRGVDRFRIERFLPGTPYLRAAVQLLPSGSCETNGSSPGDDVSHRCRVLLDLLICYLVELGAPAELLTHLPGEPDKLAYFAAAAAQVEVPEQQHVLELPTTAERINASINLLRREAGLMRHFGAVGSLRPMGPGGAELN